MSNVSEMLVGAVGCATMVFPALADGLASYSGTGTVYVLEDGRVALEYTSPSQDAHQLEIEDASEHYLISDDTTYTLLPPNTSPPSGTVSMTQLNSSGCATVGQFTGSLSVTSVGDGVWEIQVRNVSSTLIFDYLFQQTGTQGGSHACEVTCQHGSCYCDGPGICLCFCDIFGNPVCIRIALVLGITV